MLTELLNQKNTLIMGILNATPDSFSGDGKTDEDQLVQRGLKMVSAGAHILDIGGESSRPFAQPVSQEEEIKRVVPVIRRLASQTNIPISIDTYHVGTAKAAVAAGAVMVNDISGLRDPEMRRFVSSSGTYTVIMHMQGTPSKMQINPQYSNVVEEVARFLMSQAENAIKDGIHKDKIIFDPGIGFGKCTEHNILLLRHLDRLKQLGYPLLVGPSRKSFIGEILNLPVDQRLEGTLAAIAASMFHSVDMVRVHDVQPIAQFIKVLDAIVGNIDL